MSQGKIAPAKLHSPPASILTFFKIEALSIAILLKSAADGPSFAKTLFPIPPERKTPVRQASSCALPYKRKGPEVRDKNHSVPLPIAFNLFGPGHLVDIRTRRLCLYYATRRILRKKGIVLVFGGACLATELIRGEQSAIRQTCAAIC